MTANTSTSPRFLLSPDQLARRLQIGVPLVHRLTRDHLIPVIVLGPRTHRYDFDAVVRALSENPTQDGSQVDQLGE